MKKDTRFVGLDVHAETISVAVVDQEGNERDGGKIVNRMEAVRKMIKKLGPVKELHVCYEAGPTGYALYWQLAALGVRCDVIAPTLIPQKAGDRVKTDRRDAMKLARCLRNGDLTPVWVPDAAHEALRDLVRAREGAKGDQHRARQRLSKFLLRRGLRPPEGMKSWTLRYVDWIRTLRVKEVAAEEVRLDYLSEVDHAKERIERLEKALGEVVVDLPESMRELVVGLQALRGVGALSAVSIVSELGTMDRFAKAKDLMGYSGLVSREDSSGERVRRGAITKTGNAHLRRVAVESAFAYRHKPSKGGLLAKRLAKASARVGEISWKAQNRLHKRYWKLLGRGKSHQNAVTALARELLGFVWAIGKEVSAQKKQPNTVEKVPA